MFSPGTKGPAYIIHPLLLPRLSPPQSCYHRHCIDPNPRAAIAVLRRALSHCRAAVSGGPPPRSLLLRPRPRRWPAPPPPSPAPTSSSTSTPGDSARPARLGNALVQPSSTSPVLAPSSIALPARLDAARGPLPYGSEHLDAAPLQHAGDSPPTTAPATRPPRPRLAVPPRALTT